MTWGVDQSESRMIPNPCFRRVRQQLQLREFDHAQRTTRRGSNQSRAILLYHNTIATAPNLPLHQEKHCAMLRIPVQSARIHRRFLSSTPVVTRTSPRLDALRSQLAEDDETLDDFAAAPRPKNRKAPPRSSKILPKPRWLKAAPADSENYKTLRSTVRELGLATGKIVFILVRMLLFLLCTQAMLFHCYFFPLSILVCEEVRIKN